MLAMQRIVESRRKKVVGEPYEGKLHLRFEVAGNGNQEIVVVLRHSHKETESNELLHLSLMRHSLSLPPDLANQRRLRLLQA